MLLWIREKKESACGAYVLGSKRPEVDQLFLIHKIVYMYIYHVLYKDDEAFVAWTKSFVAKFIIVDESTRKKQQHFVLVRARRLSSSEFISNTHESTAALAASTTTDRWSYVRPGT